MKRLVFDFDAYKYSIASVCEKRSIITTHISSGREKEFNNRTEFWGHHKKREGGWLAELNKQRALDDKEPFLPSDFDIADKQVAQPVSYMCQTVKQAIAKVCNTLGVSSYYGYTGRGESWRVGASTIIEYKGDRKESLKPLMLEDIEDYLKRHHNATEVRGLEVDDQVVIDCFANKNLILVGIDKDFDGVEPIWLFNPDKMEREQRIEGLGKLWADAKGKVRGEGRKFFYHQLLSGDDSDCYWANSASDVKWGDKSSFKLLDPCKTDKECWQAVVDGYKSLYPEPKEITGWRGDKFPIDWQYVLAENACMAHMLRSKDDKYVVADQLDKWEIEV